MIGQMDPMVSKLLFVWLGDLEVYNSYFDMPGGLCRILCYLRWCIDSKCEFNVLL